MTTVGLYNTLSTLGIQEIEVTMLCPMEMY